MNQDEKTATMSKIKDGWRYYTIQNDKKDRQVFFAPNLEEAFNLARAHWSRARVLNCLGGTEEEPR